MGKEEQIEEPIVHGMTIEEVFEAMELLAKLHLKLLCGTEVED